MVYTIALPTEYPWVIAAAAGSIVVHFAHVLNTSSARKAAKVKYPITYASEEQAAADPNVYKFNCAQRSHANFTETLTPFLASLCIAGLQYPVLAAGLGAGFCVGRYIYMVGYTNDKPGAGGKGRMTGALIGGPSFYILTLTSWWTVAQMLMA